MKARRLPSVLVLVATGLGGQACLTDNPPAYHDVLSPQHNPPEGHSGGAGTGGVAGSSGTAGTAPTSGSSGTGGLGGTDMGGEAGATAGGEGGSGPTTGGSGGTAGSAGGGVTAGTTANPPIDPNFSPACFMGPTQAGEEIKKGTPCAPEDPEVCYRPCGPDQVGWKTETCLAGVYTEGDCTFPPEKDYSCYAIPDEIDAAACGLTAAPSATDECDAPLCTVCNLDGFYQDSGTNAKEGYCVCREPDETGKRRWTCASTTAWPCPFNQGC